MTALLRELAQENPGLLVCTSRFPFPDLDAFTSPQVLSIELNALKKETGAEYLKRLAVDGDEADREDASVEFDNHPLALTLLGKFLVTACNGDIRRRDTIPTLFMEPQQGGHARRVLRQYETFFRGTAEEALLRVVGLFDRPTEREALDLLHASGFLRGSGNRSVTGHELKFAEKRLRDMYLLYPADSTERLDCHHLVGEHFRAVFKKPIRRLIVRRRCASIDITRRAGSVNRRALMRWNPFFCGAARVRGRTASRSLPRALCQYDSTRAGVLPDAQTGSVRYKPRASCQFF
jgi:hypothetical protein